MLRVQYMLCANDVCIDQLSNMVTISGVVENITAVNFPVLLSKLVVVVSLERSSDEPEPGNCILKFKQSNGSEKPFTIGVNFQDKLISRSVLTFRPIVFESAGEAIFEFIHNETILSSYKVTVNIQTVTTADRQEVTTVST